MNLLTCGKVYRLRFTLLLLISSVATFAIKVAWDPNPPSENVTHYTVYYSFNGGTETKSPNLPASGPMEYEFSRLVNWRYFVVYVTASNAAGESDRSDPCWQIVYDVVERFSSTTYSPLSLAKIDVNDVLFIGSKFGARVSQVPSALPADVNNDGVVDGMDLLCVAPLVGLRII